MSERLRARLEENLREMEDLAREVEERRVRSDEETAELMEGLGEEVDDD